MTPQPFTVLTDIAAPLLRDNIDTDVIIRLDRLYLGDRLTYAQYLFEAWRYDGGGREAPDFVLNRAPFRPAKILLAGRNFGCGSSREGAVWALQSYGIRSVIAASFGGIFFNNCFQNGILPVVLPLDTIAAMAAQVEAAPETARVTVDLQAQTVRGPDGAAHGFDIDPLRRRAMLEGLDDIGLTMTRADDIAAFQARDRADRPWVWQVRPGVEPPG